MIHSRRLSIVAVAVFSTAAVSWLLLNHTTSPSIQTALNEQIVSASGHQLSIFTEGLSELNSRFRNGQNPFIRSKPSFASAMLRRVQRSSVWHYLGFAPLTVHAQACFGSYNSDESLMCTTCGDYYPSTISSGTDPCSGSMDLGDACTPQEDCSDPEDSSQTCDSCF